MILAVLWDNVAMSNWSSARFLKLRNLPVCLVARKLIISLGRVENHEDLPENVELNVPTLLCNCATCAKEKKTVEIVNYCGGEIIHV